MEIRGKVAIVTGGASGIGAGLAKRLVAEGACGVVVADVNLERAEGVARAIGAVALRCDVSRERSDGRLRPERPRSGVGGVDVDAALGGRGGSRASTARSDDAGENAEGGPQVGLGDHREDGRRDLLVRLVDV